MSAPRFLRLAGQWGRWGLRGLGTLILWSLWLALSLLLALQIRIASTERLEVPPFVLRALENRLAASGMRATFGRTTFDPSGRVLLEDLALTPPSSAEPLITARGVYARLDPWALTVGRVEPLELRATGVSLRVPAMLSPSGRAEELVRDLDVAVRPRGGELEIEYASCRIGDLPVTLRGGLHLGPVQAGRAAASPLVDFVARNYGNLSRQFAAALVRLRVFDQPVLEAVLTPSETQVAIVRATLRARGLKLGPPIALEASDVNFAADFPLLRDAPSPVAVDASARALRLTGRGEETRADAVHVRISGTLTPGPIRFDWTGAEGTAARVAAAGFAVDAPIVSVAPGPLPRLRGEARALLAGSAVATRGVVDLRAGTADLTFVAALSPGLLDPVGARLKRNLHPLIGFSDPIRAAGETWLGAGWRFQRAEAWVEARGITAYHVPIDEARGRLEFDGRRLSASQAYARLGPSFGRGSYEQDLATHRYRFLLDGRLQPLAISAWFPNAPWWRDFFGNFAFPGPPPSASVDVRGRTDTGREARVVVLVDSARPVIRGVPFDRALARLFVRPDFDDGLEVWLVRGSGSARGTFSRRFDFDHDSWQSLDLDLASTLDLGPMPKLVGPDAGGAFTAFAFAQPPTLALRGHLYWTRAPGGSRNDLDLGVRSAGPLRFHDFPLDRADFHASIHNGDVTVDRAELGFADGRFSGRAAVTGTGAGRRLRFDGALQDANLDRAVAAFEDFSARKTGAPQPALGQYVAPKARVRLDATATAEGAYEDPMSITGSGTAALQGAELGQVQLLGALSKVLKFTALRFTSASAAFRIEGGHLVFPSIKVSGANSDIEAHGDYGIDRHVLDFDARIWPFGKSSTIPQKLLNVALAPLSQVLAMKLTGTIENPSWSLALGLGGRRPSGSAAAPAQGAPPAAGNGP